MRTDFEEEVDVFPHDREVDSPLTGPPGKPKPEGQLMSEKWFTADTHFGHTNIIEHCNRPFGSADEMDSHMIARLNDCVGEGDVLYHLGDFSFGNSRGKIEDYRSSIRCKNIVLLKGNHDPQKKSGWFVDLFTVVHDMFTVKVRVGGTSQKIVLCHYPLASWDGSFHGSWHLHGHCHGMKSDEGLFRVDVGVDCHRFRPLSLSEIAVLMEGRQPNKC